jgi:hypothetical protein
MDKIISWAPTFTYKGRAYRPSSKDLKELSDGTMCVRVKPYDKALLALLADASKKEIRDEAHQGGGSILQHCAFRRLLNARDEAHATLLLADDVGGGAAIGLQALFGDSPATSASMPKRRPRKRTRATRNADDDDAIIDPSMLIDVDIEGSKFQAIKPMKLGDPLFVLLKDESIKTVFDYLSNAMSDKKDVHHATFKLRADDSQKHDDANHDEVADRVASADQKDDDANHDDVASAESDNKSDE